MIGVILLNLGGPDSLAAVKPFLYNLFSDREIIKLGPSFLQKPIAWMIANTRAKKTIAAYEMIGGKSPILDISTAQAEALEHALRECSTSGRILTAVGMMYWHPTIEETVEKMYKEGVRKIIVLSLYPQFSVATTGASIRRFKAAVERYPIDYFCIQSWYDHPLYIEALVEKIEEGIAPFTQKPAVLFSAHSLPQKFIDEGDPYLNEIKGTIEAIVKQIDIDWYLSYQSKSGPVKWLEPSTEEMLQHLAEKGVKELLVVPISFVSDHIETLYEIDILYRDMAAKLGITLKRTESLNTSKKFIEALNALVLQTMKKLRWV